MFTKSSVLISVLICVIIKTVLREFCSLADPPEGVLLQVSEETVCKGANVIFSCSVADASPMELTYHIVGTTMSMTVSVTVNGKAMALS